MDLAKYQELTGYTVPANQVGTITAQCARSKAILESLLGYSLSPDSGEGESLTQPRLTNLYIEQGISPVDCACSNVEVEDLLPADDVQFAYRLFPYNDKDKYLHIDPATEVGSVKLVKDGVTIRVFESHEIRVDYGKDGLIRYIEICEGCGCSCSCDDSCVQLAVDADWAFEELPLDLLYVWSDMVSFYGDCQWNIKSQSVLSHSYTKFDNSPPQEWGFNQGVIKRYIGPHGSLAKVVTV